MANINFEEYPPAEDLRLFVENFWSSQVDEDGSLRLLPTACSVLMTCYVPGSEDVLFVGPMSKAHITGVKKGEQRAGVWLQPGTKFVLSNVDTSAMKDVKLYSHDLHHQAVAKFKASLQDQPSLDVKLRGLEVLLRTLVRDGMLKRDPTVDVFLKKARSSREVSYKDLLESVNQSERQFRRRFKEFVGLTPQEYLRILRQRQAIQMLARGRPGLCRPRSLLS